jgi:DNA polymerase III subunit delta'
LRPLPALVVRQAIEENYGADHERAALLAQLSGGRIGWAIQAAKDESMLTQRTEWLDRLEEAIGLSRVGRFALAESLSKDKPLLFSVLDLWLSYWRDALLLANAAITPITNRDRRHALDQISLGVKVDEIYKTIKAIDRTSRYVDQNVNTRLAVEVLMLDLPRLRLLAAPPG